QLWKQLLLYSFHNGGGQKLLAKCFTIPNRCPRFNKAKWAGVFYDKIFHIIDGCYNPPRVLNSWRVSRWSSLPQRSKSYPRTVAYSNVPRECFLLGGSFNNYRTETCPTINATKGYLFCLRVMVSFIKSDFNSFMV